ncbi:sensor domain-containing protein [Streptomyces sp. NBC_01465]|uniref:sensor domain-containing protein n=1 Tax=Streptomyces sp. NBC_01465 TaxID=2903878 RepID=UPI002E376BFF|nr:sensor domain-containing protein [Streptomyces sp. NBC_01465]
MDLTQQPLTRTARPAAGRTGARARALARVILREPFRAETWLRLAYIVLALPVGLLCIPLALVGGPAGRIQRGLARRLLGVQVEEPARTGPLALVHALISAPLNLVAVAFSGFFWLVVVINLGYPLRPDNDPSGSWGGPTMAGAWALHAACGGIGFLLLTPWVMKGFTALQTRLVKGFLGTDRTGLLRTTGLALAIAAVCALFSIPLIHQL